MASSTLPQHDPDPGARRGALESARARYVYDPTVLPPFNLSGELPATAVAKGLLLALVVALVGGGYPAWRAMRLTPLEGLSHE